MSSDEGAAKASKVPGDAPESEDASSQQESEKEDTRTDDELEEEAGDTKEETDRSNVEDETEEDEAKEEKITDETEEENLPEGEEEEEEILQEGTEEVGEEVEDEEIVGEEEFEDEEELEDEEGAQSKVKKRESAVRDQKAEGDSEKEIEKDDESDSEGSGDDIFMERDERKKGKSVDIKKKKSKEKETEDEYEEDGEEEEEEVEEEEIGELLSGPVLSEESTVPWDVFVFYHSFGYDCRRHYNLCIPDPETVIFASGNYINFFNIVDKKLTFRRSARGGGIGHIVKNPKHPHVAVGEKGENPLIIIYEWPSMERVCLLRGGTERAFACLQYSPDGKYLCSQGGEPDYFLTVWNWEKAKIVRQQKAYGQDVYNAMFSQYCPGNLTTSGYGHIKFWKLARTFTGLKLMGSIGRFGKTEMCDIIGFVQLPDEQVISGCEWGNMLIWNEGLVKAQVCRKNEVPCHDGYISQLLYDEANEELITVGTDGFVRAWDFQLIERSDVSGDEQKIRIETLHALEVGKGPNKSQLLYIEKQEPDSEKTMWFAQDGNGGIWLIDLDQDHPQPSTKIFSCHAGGVRSISSCPTDNYIASYGEDGRIIFYNYIKKKTILVHKFAAGGGFMVWPTLDVEPTGRVVICGGADGMLRVAVVALREREAASADAEDSEFIRLIQTSKPHTARVTYIVVHRSRQVLVTGSEDATIFVYQLLTHEDYLTLNPIGFVKMPSAVTHMTWKHLDKPVILVSCFGGQVLEVDVPDVPSLYTKVSYELTELNMSQIDFVSVKSQIRRDLFLEEIANRRKDKLAMKKEKLAAMKKDNPNMKIDEKLFLEDSESTVTLDSLYFPEVPNPILFSMYLPNKTIWVSPGGYDAGYMYVYQMGSGDPLRCKMIANADDIEIHSCIHDPTGHYVILGLQNGKIRVCKINTEDYCDLSDYWELPLHDNDNGIISEMCYSFDKKIFFTCGQDGNIFAFTVTSQMNKPPVSAHPRKKSPWPAQELEDISDEDTYSLEQLKVKAERDRKKRVADGHKEHVLAQLEKYKNTFISLLEKNDVLPLKVKIPYGEFIVDHRIEDDLETELEDIMKLEKRKLAFQAEKSALCLKKVQDYFYNVLDSQLVMVYGIKIEVVRAYTFRNRVLPPEFFEAKKFIEDRLVHAEKAQRAAPQRTSRYHAVLDTGRPLPLGSWLKGLSSVGANVKMNVKLQRMLLKYYERKRKTELRQELWNEMMKTKPDPKVSHPDDVIAIQNAESTIGDYKMKTDTNYAVLKKERVTTDTKFQQLLLARERVFKIQKEYDNRVYKLRDKKVALIDYITDMHAQLAKIHDEIPEMDRKTAPRIPVIRPEEEFSELALKLREEDIEYYLPERSASKDRFSFGDMDDNDDEEIEKHEENESLSLLLASGDREAKLDINYEILLTDPEAPPPIKNRKIDSSLLPRKKLPKKYSADKFLSDIKLNDYIAKSGDDLRDTAWEKEMRFRRLCRSLYVQDKIISDVEKKIDEFDTELIAIKDDRFQVAVEVKFGELHLLKIHQEIIILKDYEAVEDSLAAIVHNTEEEIHGLESKLAHTETRIEMHKKEIEHLSEREKQLLAVFNEAIEDHPYSDFLRKIYKKKFKPPKEKRGDDESSSSSSSDSDTSTEDDGESVDSQDLRILKLDENICPPDLDRDLYDMTFALRAERHSVEIKTTEEKKLIEVLKKEMEVESKKLKVLDKNLEKQKGELLEFQREKQHRLNEVQCVVALKARQMQYFEDPAADLVHMDDKLVFSCKMLEALMSRVGELQKESAMQKNKNRRYRKHYFRMNIDCKHMQDVINLLKLQINDTLVKKFGSILKIDEVEDILLQRLINEMKSPLQDIKDEFHRVAAILKAEIRKSQNELSSLYIANSEKINVLTILENEKYNLNLLVAKQGLTKDEITYLDLFESAEELKKLRRVIKNQEKQINLLKDDIKNLTYKGKPLPPICTTMLEEALRQAARIAAEKEEIPDVSDEEEDEDMFMYMDSADAVDLVTERSSLDDTTRLPSPQQILEELLQRVPIDDEVEITKVLDSAIEKLINKIPLTNDAISILDEVIELISNRLTYVDDPQGLREVLFNMVHDMESLPTTPSKVRVLLQSVLNKVKAKEAEVDSAIHARAIMYDILRKCVGFVLGQKFFLTTEEAMLQILDALKDSEVSAIVEELLSNLATKVEEYAGQPLVQEVLEDVIHQLHSLEFHEKLKQIFTSIFRGFGARMKPERDLAVARHVLHDTLKKAIGIVAETLHPITEREFLAVENAIFMILEKLSSIPDTIPLFDELEMQLQDREANKDTPDIQNLVQRFSDDINDRPPMKSNELIPFFKEVLSKFESSGASKIDKLQAYAVTYDVIRRSVLFAFPDIDISEIHRLVDPAVIILSLLDKIPSETDTTKLFEDIIDDLNEKNKEELFSEAVQNMLPELIQNLVDAETKESGVKNTFAGITQTVKDTKTFKHDITSVLKMLLDATKNSRDLLYPKLMIEEDEDVTKAQQSIVKLLDYIQPDTYSTFITSLADVLEEWEAKRSDPPEVPERIQEVIYYLRTAPEEPKRIKRTVSYIFKLINYKGPTKNVVMRILSVFKYGTKDAIRSTLPEVDIPVEHTHFDPDESTLAMLFKIPKTMYLTYLIEDIRNIITDMKKMENVTPDILKIFDYFLDALASLPEDDPPIYKTFKNGLERIKRFDVSRSDNIYARIYLNDAVRKGIRTVFPRVVIKEAKCCMDKERPTKVMIMKIPLGDDAFVLYDEIREELQTKFETIENDPEVHKAVHDVLLVLSEQPENTETILCIYDSVAMNIRQQNIPRLAILTTKNIFYESARKCIELVFPLLDISDDNVIDKEFPIVQMFRLIPDRKSTDLIAEIIEQLHAAEGTVEESVKPILSTFIEDASQRLTETGDIDLIYPCIKRIKDSKIPIKDFKAFKEVLYTSIKKAIQKTFPDIDLQDNQTAWENEERLLVAAEKLPETDDPSLMIDNVREYLHIVRSSTAITDGLKHILQEVEHHLTVMPIDKGGYEHTVDSIFTILESRRGEARDIAQARTEVYKILQRIMELIHEKSKEDDAATDTSVEGKS